MKVGDLVMFRNCAQVGTAGVITMLTESSPVAKDNPELRIYWVLCAQGVQCFTGGQLVVI